jgi:hypothetical protein
LYLNLIVKQPAQVVAGNGGTNIGGFYPSITAAPAAPFSTTPPQVYFY